MMDALELLYQGKAKSAYVTEDPELLILKFRDDTSAFDGEIIEQLSEKGAINNQFNAVIMQKLADAGIPMGVMRGVALLARCAGLLGHLVEEQTDPIGIDVYMNVDRNIDYQPPK